MAEDVLGLRRTLTRESRIQRRLRDRGIRPKARSGMRQAPKSKLSILRRAETKIAGKAMRRVSGRVTAPLAVGLAAYEVGKAVKEGYKAYEAHKHLSKTRAHTTAKYGSIEKAIATRKKMQRR